VGVFFSFLFKTREYAAGIFLATIERYFARYPKTQVSLYMARITNNQQRKHRPDSVSIGILIGFVLLAGVTATMAFILIRNLVMGWTISSLPGEPVVNNSPVVDPQTGLSNPVMQPVENVQSKPWDGKSRVNILFMGLDFRDWQSGDIPRTDTMILFTIDPITRNAGMLSIPRDIWANIPGFDYAKINTAYYFGEAYHMPGGGAALAMQTVSEFLGVPVNDYIQLDFNTFVKIIDQLGGVAVTPNQDMKLERIGTTGYEEHLKAGVTVRLDGAMLLSYARNRYTDGGDFDRAQRQQEVILAIRNRILKYDMLPKLLAKAPAIYQDLSSGIHTSFNLQQLIQLAQLAIQIRPENIARSAIGPDQTINGWAPDGQEILIPIPDEIRVVRDQIFSTGGSASPVALATDPAGSMTTEQAKVVVQNGTNYEGLAGKTAEYLQSEGLNIVQEGNAGQVYDQSAIYLYGAKPYTLQYLSGLFGVDSNRVWNSYDPTAQADIVVIVGNDWASSNPMP
jgi:LCP family protein required for cell wall assembly